MNKDWKWRDYQGGENGCFESIIDAYHRGITQQLIVQATGLGKRSQAIFVAGWFKKSLFLAHSEELIDQAYNDFVKWYGEENVGMIRGNRMDLNKRFIVSSPLTIVNRLDKIPSNLFDLVQIDECHHYMARLFYKAATYFICKMRLGWTATPQRLDGLSMMDLFQEITFQYGILRGIKEGHLAELKGIRITTNVNISSAHKAMGDFQVGELSNLVDIPERNKLIVDSHIKYANGRQFIVFCVDTDHAVNVHAEFVKAGFNVGLLVSNKNLCSDAQREQIDYDFKHNIIQGIININIATEGYDYDNIGAIHDASPTMSVSRYLQRVGRGTRIKPMEYQSLFGNVCLILDYVDLSSRHKLVNTFELDKTVPAKEKIFVTTEDRLKILEVERQRAQSKIIGVVEKDEYFELAAPPKIRISKSEKMMEEATPAQIKLLTHCGLYQKFDEDGLEIEYTKKSVSELLNTAEILPWMKRKMIEWKYNPTGAVIAQYLSISAERRIRENQEEIKRAQERSINQLKASLEEIDLPF